MEKLDNLFTFLKKRCTFVPSSELPGSTKAIFHLLWSEVIKYNIVLKLSACHSTCVLDTYVELTCLFSTIKNPQHFQHLLLLLLLLIILL